MFRSKDQCHAVLRVKRTQHAILYWSKICLNLTFTLQSLCIKTQSSIVLFSSLSCTFLSLLVHKLIFGLTRRRAHTSARRANLMHWNSTNIKFEQTIIMIWYQKLVTLMSVNLLQLHIFITFGSKVRTSCFERSATLFMLDSSFSFDIEHIIQQHGNFYNSST